MDRSKFFAAIKRTSMFGDSLSQSQVNGISGILDAFASHGDGRVKSLAYTLATARHEVGSGMVPVREGFADTDAEARRIVSAAKRSYARPAGPYGHVYYGRGHVQLTWLKNYEGSTKDAGVNIVKYPDEMLDPVISARVMVRGILDGRWNGKRKGIGFYLPTIGPDDLKNARRTVNVTDKWELIGGYYKAFLAALKDAGYTEGKPAPPVPASPAPEVQKPVPSRPERSIWAALVELVMKWLGRK